MKYLVINFEEETERDETIAKLLSLGYCFTKYGGHNTKRLRNAEDIDKIKQYLRLSRGDGSSICLGEYSCNMEWEMYFGTFYSDLEYTVVNPDDFFKNYLDFDIQNAKKEMEGTEEETEED